MIKHDPDNSDPLAYEAVVRGDGSFDAAAMHSGLNALVGEQGEEMNHDFGGRLTRAELTFCLTALANTEAMRTFLVATLGSCVGLQLPLAIVAADVNDMLEAAEYSAKSIADRLGMIWDREARRVGAS